MHSIRKLKKFLIVIAVLTILLTSAIAVYSIGTGAVEPGNDNNITVNIPSGSGASSIVKILDDNGLIRNMTMAKIHARIGQYHSLQANCYVFSKSMTLSEMFDAINTGDFDYISKEKITIREGTTIPEAAKAMSEIIPLTADEIREKLSDEGYLETLVNEYWFITDDILNEDIIDPLEGYLYPETYFITEEEPTVESITTIMLDKMDSELTKRKAEIENSDYSVHEILTLSSIVEKEASNSKEDMPEVAGVFINRLKNDIALGSDVTVNYIFDKDGVELTMSQLNSDSKYNTRKFTGFPPGPISAVNETAIDSVLNYKNTDYMFFYATPEGEIIFSKTMDEHNKAIEENPW